MVNNTNSLHFELTCIMLKGEEVLNTLSITINQGEMLTLQSLLQQSLFYILGWQILGSQQILDSDIGEIESKPATKPLSPFKRG